MMNMVEKKYDITYSTDIDSGYPKRLEAFPHQNLRVFFVPSVRYGREIVEFIQRTGLKVETVTNDRAWDLNKWGIGDYYDIRASIGDFHIIQQNLENVLTSDEHFDVLVLPGINGWDEFSSKTKAEIKKRVEAGAGLILIKPFHGGEPDNSSELDLLSPLHNLFEEQLGIDENADGGYPKIEFDLLRKERWVAEKHYITDGIPFELFPYEELAYYPYKASGETIIHSESGDPIAAVKEFGKGRIAAFGYYPRDILPQHAEFTGKESTYDAVIDQWGGAYHSRTYPYLEYFYELIYRSIIWSCRRTPSTRIEDVQVNGLQVSLQPALKYGYEIRYTIKDSHDLVVTEGVSSVSTFRLPDFLTLGGSYRVEINLMDGEELADWSTLSVDFPLTVKTGGVTFDREHIASGGRVSTSIQLTGSPCDCVISVIDDFERVLSQKKFSNVSNTTLNYEFLAENIVSMHFRFRAEVFVKDHRISLEDSSSIIVTPEQRKLDDFEVFMCPQNRGQGDWLPLVGDLFRNMGVTGLFPGSSRTLTMSGAKGLGVYWYHRGSYVKQKEAYLRTRDKSYLCRVPCLNDPAFWQEMSERIRTTIRENRKYGPVSYFANDEGSLTCYVDELDLCFCDHCMKAMQIWLSQKYHSLEKLNEIWGTHFTAWEQVVPYTLEEAQAAQHFASWGDHRRFMEHTFANAYRKMNETIREEDPNGVIRMSGCQASTAYSGYDYYELHRHVGYFEAYGVGNQLEFHRSFARPGTIIGGWFGYGSDGTAVRNQIWNAVYHNLTLMSIFWEYSCLNPDFTYSRSAKDMAEAFLEIKREGIGKLLLHTARRDSLGIAVHYSMASIHGAHVLNDTTRFEKNRQGWIDILEDLGYQYQFVASQQIAAGELMDQGYKLFILPYSIALSDNEVREIHRFVHAGGIVLGDFQTALMDENCKLNDAGKLDKLFGIERLNRDAKPFYINNGFSTQTNFPYFNFNLSHNPGHEDEASGLTMVEIGTRETDGKAAYHDDFMGSVASVVVHPYGKGKGIYLNLALDSYPSLRLNGGGGLLRTLLKHMMKLSGVCKPVALLDDEGSPVESGFETIYYSDGEAEYVCVQSRLEKLGVGHDGLSVGGGKKIKQHSVHLTVKFHKKGHIYSIREKRYFGFTDVVATMIPHGDTQLFAILPYGVDELKLDVPEKIKRGETFKGMIQVLTDKPAGSYSHVINVQCLNPDGEYSWIYSENRTLSNSEDSFSFNIPLNERTGTWKLIVKDAATGIKTAASFEIV